MSGILHQLTIGRAGRIFFRKMGSHLILPGKNDCIFFALERSLDTDYDTLGGFAPAAMASPGCDYAVLSVCRCGKISRSGNAGVSQCPPAPHEGRAGAKGVITT